MLFLVVAVVLRGTPKATLSRVAAVRYVALLRGINVGGKTLVKMAALKACFEDLGFQGSRPTSRAATSSSRAGGGRRRLAASIEAGLERGSSCR